MAFKLIDLINLTPEFKWNYTYLSSNPNIYLEDIPINNGNILPFDKYILSHNPNLRFDWLYNNFLSIGEYGEWDWTYLSRIVPLHDILEHPELYWIMITVSERIIDINILLEYPEIKWNWDKLSEKIPLDQIISHPELPWNYRRLSNNPTLTIKFMLENKDNFGKFMWSDISISKNISLKEIINNAQFPWLYNQISLNPTLTSEFLLEHINKGWNWISVFGNWNINYDILAESKINLSDKLDYVLTNSSKIITHNKNLTIKFIRKYKTIFLIHKSVFADIHGNGIITLQDIEEDPELIVSYDFFSMNPNLTIDYVLANKDKPWNMNNLSENSAFKMIDILKGFESVEIPNIIFPLRNLVKPFEYKIEWNFEGLSKNPNITFEFIYDNKDKNWSQTYLVINKFTEQQKINIKESGLKNILISDINNIVLEY